MSEDKISSYIDRVSFKADTDFALAELTRLEEVYRKLRDSKVNLSTSLGMKDISENAAKATEAIKEITAATADLTTKITANVQVQAKQNLSLQDAIAARERLKNSLNSYKESLKEDADLLKAGAINQEEYKKRVVESTVKVEEYKNKISALNKEIKDQTKLSFAVPNSVAGARSQNLVLTGQRDKLDTTDPEDIARIKELNALIDRNNKLIDENSDSLAKQKINVGNYQGSAKLIIDALEKQQSRLQSLTSSYTSFGSQIDKQKGIVSQLSNDINSTDYKGAVSELKRLEIEYDQTGKQVEQTRTVIEGFRRVADKPTFLTAAANVGDTTKELRFFTKQLNELEDAGLKNSQLYQDLQKRLAELTDQLGDTRDQIKALASDTRGFDLFAGAVTFAADSFTVLAGATVLFGGSEEDAAEATATLTAIQSVSNGVKGIANELTTKGTFANKIFEFSQRQIAIAMDETATASARLKAALVSVGIGALIVGVGLLIANFSKLKDSLTGASDSKRILDQAIGDSKYTDAVRQVKELTLNIGLAKQGFLDKKEVLKEYNDTVGKTTGQVTTLDEAEAALVKNGPAYIRMMLLKAAAQLALQEAAKAAVDAQIDNEKRLKVAAEVTKAGQSEADKAAGADGLSSFLGSGLKNEADAAKRDADAGIKSLEDISAKFQKDAAEIAKNNKFDFFGGGDDKTAAKKDKSAEKAAEAERKAQQAIYILRLEDQKAFNAAIADNDEKSTGARIEAALNEADFEQRIIQARASFEISNAKLTGVQRAAVQAKADSEILQGAVDLNKKLQAIRKAGADQAATAAANRAGGSLTGGFNDFTTGSIQRELDALKKKADAEYAILKGAKDKKVKLEVDFLSQVQEVAGKVFGVIEGALNASATRRKNELEVQSNDIDARTAKEIEAVNASVLSEQDKAAKIAIINARAQAQKEQIAQQQKKIDREAAIAQKAFSIFQIILGTAVSVAKASTVFEKILAAALGAAQLAVAIATPIPKFKHGKGAGNDYEGPAIVGDGGVSEYIQRADGTIEKTPAKDTLTYLGKNDIVFKDHMAMMKSLAMPGIMVMPVMGAQPVHDSGMERALPLLERIANKRENHISAKDGALVGIWKYGASQTKYVDENCNW